MKEKKEVEEMNLTKEMMNNALDFVYSPKESDKNGTVFIFNGALPGIEIDGSDESIDKINERLGTNIPYCDKPEQS